MKTWHSRVASLCAKTLILACLFASWALSRPVAAQSDSTGELSDELNDEAAPVELTGGSEDVFAESSQAAERPIAAKATPQKRKGIPTKLSDLFMAGGPLMWPIAACSVIVLAFSIERLVVLRRRRVIPKDFVTRFLEHLANGQLDRSTALQLCAQNGSPIADVFAHGVRKWGKPSVEVEQAIIDGGERQISQLRKHLRVLNTVATVSPLLGLLGTVQGMIKCFNELATTTAIVGKTEKLAEGIGMALVATGGGLCVAIPALILYMYLAGRVDSVVMDMDMLGQKVVHLISAEGLASHPGEHPRLAPRPKT